MFGLRTWFDFDVEAPIDAVWEYCADEANLPEYMPMVREVVVEEKTATSLRYSMVVASTGERQTIAASIIRFEPPREYVTRTKRAFYDLLAGYRFEEPAPRRTRVCFLVGYEFSPWQSIVLVLGGPLTVLFHGVLYLVLRRTFRRLKEVLEAKAKANAFRGYRS